MKASELREGNWIITKPDAPFIQSHVMQVSAQAIANYSEHYNGIELNEEWLIKLGFQSGVHDNEVYYININDLSKQLELMPASRTWYPTLVQSPEMPHEDPQMINLNSISYVHELMNLFYSLSGEELKLKE